MAGSWHMVNRNPYLSGSQKLVQARMYAQGGTLAALLGSFAIEGADEVEANSPPRPMECDLDSVNSLLVVA